ncbi:glycosyltransferase family 32 protein [Rufibacter sp. XAAS-G3-1]|uniref:glycosyltransferase family 32 protein n=1 Tax=Rufibacter sp. XAAS-G3-1 TaxID=2729134 RepID=UPI0015E6AEDC|nr:glycosyltransferase [Rufibacter sp. XAAS-G3-1]
MAENKIPKIIHYCWFSGEEIPAFLTQCIDSWKELMPDYKLRLWDSTSFDFESVPFVKEAYKAKKWAFVADYIRLYALFHEGGIYLDSDVKVFKRFDKFLVYNFFTSHEIHPDNFNDTEKNKLNKYYQPINKNDYIYGLNIQAAIMGSSKGNSYIKECLDFYIDKHFIGEDGTQLSKEFIIGPYISKIAEKYGYVYNKKEQLLDNHMLILEPEVFVGNTTFLTKDSYAVHLCNGSWKEKSLYEICLYNIRNKFPKVYPLIILGTKLYRAITKI